MRELIEIVEYDPSWPGQFNTIRDQLKSALGDLAISIDHIGSTSVPKLSAKDRIDVQVTISPKNSKNVKTLNDKLANHNLGECVASADHVPPGDMSDQSHWKKYFLSGNHFEYMCNIHIRTLGKKNHRYALLFRDYLRFNPDAATAYTQIKQKIATYLPHERDAYSDIKDPVCDLIMLNAEKWATETEWTISF